MGLTKLFQRRDQMGKASRNLAAALRSDECTCGHASLGPLHHAETCGYRAYWRKIKEDTLRDYPELGEEK